MERRELLAGVVLGVTVGAPAGGAAASLYDGGDGPAEMEPKEYDESAGSGEVADAVASAVNAERDEPLERREELDDVARSHSRDMAEAGYVSGVNQAGENVASRYEKFGLAGELSGRARTMIEDGAECHALVRSDATAEQATASIMNTWAPGSRQGRWLRSGSWAEHGVGAAEADDFVYVTQCFL